MDHEQNIARSGSLDELQAVENRKPAWLAPAPRGLAHGPRKDAPTT